MATRGTWSVHVSWSEPDHTGPRDLNHAAFSAAWPWRGNCDAPAPRSRKDMGWRDLGAGPFPGDKKGKDCHPKTKQQKNIKTKIQKNSGKQKSGKLIQKKVLEKIFLHLVSRHLFRQSKFLFSDPLCHLWYLEHIFQEIYLFLLKNHFFYWLLLFQ